MKENQLDQAIKDLDLLSVYPNDDEQIKILKEKVDQEKLKAYEGMFKDQQKTDTVRTICHRINQQMGLLSQHHALLTSDELIQNDQASQDLLRNLADGFRMWANILSPQYQVEVYDEKESELKNKYHHVALMPDGSLELKTNKGIMRDPEKLKIISNKEVE